MISSKAAVECCRLRVNQLLLRSCSSFASSSSESNGFSYLRTSNRKSKSRFAGSLSTTVLSASGTRDPMLFHVRLKPAMHLANGALRSLCTESVALNPSPKTASSWWEDSFFNLVKRYEDIIGITEVKAAQARVIEAESEFSKYQETRRDKQEDINRLQHRLKEIHIEFDKTSRGEDRYLTLLTQEHAVVKEEKQLLQEFRALEKEERNQFHVLSSALRFSHEKEREQAERTKYWSIIGSIVGALIALCAATITNQMRMRQLRGIVLESSDSGMIRQVVEDLTKTVVQQREQVDNVRSFLADLRLLLVAGGGGGDQQTSGLAQIRTPPPAADLTTLSERSQETLRLLQSNETLLRTEMTDLKRMLATERGYELDQHGYVIYVGPELSELLEQTERNLEWKMKMQTVLNVVLIYSALALTVPLLYAVFGAR